MIQWPKITINATQLHYTLATLATIPLIARYAIGKQFDPGYATWVTAYWVAAIGGDKLNTVNPNLPTPPTS